MLPHKIPTPLWIQLLLKGIAAEKGSVLGYLTQVANQV